MQLTFDSDSRAMYINLTGRTDYTVDKTIEMEPEVFVDLDKNGKILGIEILNPGFYSFHFLEKIAEQYNVPDLKRIHPEKIGELISA